MDREYRPAPMSLAQRAALQSQAPRTLRRPERRRVYPLLILLILLAVVVLAVGGFEYQYRDRVLPRVAVAAAGVNLGGQTRETATAQLQPFVEAQRSRAIRLLVRGRAPTVVPAYKLGYTLDGGLTAWRAWTVGHDGDLAHRAMAQAKTLTSGADVVPAQRVYTPALRRYLLGLAARARRAPAPGVPGQRLYVTAAQRLIVRRLLAQTGPLDITLPVIAIPALPARPATPPVKHKHPVRKHK